MGGYNNPVLSGLLQGFSLAHRIKGERNEQEAIERTKRRDADEKEIRDLSTQQGLRDRGYELSTPEQDAEIATGQAMGKVQVPGLMGTIDGPVQSDIKTRLAKYGGNTYVRKTDAELNARATAQHKAELQTKLDDAEALAGPADARKLKAHIDQNAADMVKVPGQAEPVSPKILPFLQAEATGKRTEATATLNRDASNKRTADTIQGRKDVAGMPAKNGGASRGITPYQQTQIDRQNANDHAAQQSKAQKVVDDLDKLERPLHDQMRSLGAQAMAIGNGTERDAKGKLIKRSEVERNTMLEKIKAQIGAKQEQAKSFQDRKHAAIMQFSGGAAPPPAAAGGAPNDPLGIL